VSPPLGVEPSVLLERLPVGKPTALENLADGGPAVTFRRLLESGAWGAVTLIVCDVHGVVRGAGLTMCTENACRKRRHSERTHERT
jgi:hypothetical protein